MNINPVTFNEDAKFYNQLGEKYLKHDFGLFILAPSGAGKSHFCRGQKEKHWIDGDDLWMGSHAHPEGPWWLEPIDTMNRIDKRSDIVTMEAMYEGFWVMGASNFWLKPSAIVLPDWEQHVAYIKFREENNYDGGAKSDRLKQVEEHRAAIEKWHTDHGVPLFKSVDEAVKSLSR